jgi:hypothetical protein
LTMVALLDTRRASSSARGTRTRPSMFTSSTRRHLSSELPSMPPLPRPRRC